MKTFSKGTAATKPAISERVSIFPIIREKYSSEWVVDIFNKTCFIRSSIRSCLEVTGHGNRALETLRCLLSDESLRGCDLCDAEVNKSSSTVNN
jgi:hypothetical protein